MSSTSTFVLSPLPLQNRWAYKFMSQKCALPLSARHQSSKAAHCTPASCASAKISKTAIVTNNTNSCPPTTQICVGLTGKTVEEQCREMLAGKEAGADIAEIRVDLLSSEARPDWQTILKRKVLPVIVTNRAVWEGGMASENEQERLSVLLDAMKLGAEFIDVELKAVDDFRSISQREPQSSTKLILSHHNFKCPMTEAEVEEVYESMVIAGADVCKIAMMATSARDNCTVIVCLARLQRRPFIFIAMGELGQISRILAPKFGSFLTFASVGDGRESAPGQVDVVTLCSLYRFKSISPHTKVYGLVGNPVAHSMSPAVHNGAFADAGIDAVYVPVKVDDDVDKFIKCITPLCFSGFSVTIPGKVSALKAMDHVEELAAKIRAMNTVVKQQNGELWGFNTDWTAAVSAIEEGLSAVGKSIIDTRVLCIGAGGTARSLCYGALSRGAGEVVIANRTLEKAVSLAQELGERATYMALHPDVLLADTRFDVVMNTSSVGMHPLVDATPLPANWLRVSQPLVFDAVYNPLSTRLLTEAAKEGCVCVSGIEMFLRQAVEQFRLWHPGVEPDVQRMRNIVMERLE